MGIHVARLPFPGILSVVQPPHQAARIGPLDHHHQVPVPIIEIPWNRKNSLRSESPPIANTRPQREKCIFTLRVGRNEDGEQTRVGELRKLPWCEKYFLFPRILWVDRTIVGKYFPIGKSLHRVIYKIYFINHVLVVLPLFHGLASCLRHSNPPQRKGGFIELYCLFAWETVPRGEKGYPLGREEA